ncbi:MAG: ABC transporter ATP-binding protein [Rubrobacter sp.]|nr:ABC transporter ATP-binding protein [Rubrobacter sp.]
MLKTEGLGITFGGLKAVDAVDFEVERGTVAAIIGPNGAGKSTFFNLVSGFYRPTSGHVTLEDEEITNLPAHRTVRSGMARTFQTTNLFKESSALDNVIVGHRVRTRSNIFDAIFRTPRSRRENRQCRDRAMEALSFVGVDHLADRTVGSLPQEAQKRISIALALATDPKIVLLDEPAAGVNNEETQGLMDLIRKMVEHDYTVCLVEHKMGMIMGLADKIMVLNYGQKIAEGPPEEIQADESVIEAYLGAEEEGEEDA